MTNQELKNKLGEYTEQLESKLEPYQRGLILIALTAFLIFAIYYLTKSEPKLNAKKESQREKEIEEKLMRQMAFFKRLKE